MVWTYSANPFNALFAGRVEVSNTPTHFDLPHIIHQENKARMGWGGLGWVGPLVPFYIFFKDFFSFNFSLFSILKSFFVVRLANMPIHQGINPLFFLFLFVVSEPTYQPAEERGGIFNHFPNLTHTTPSLFYVGQDRLTHLTHLATPSHV